MKWKKKYKLFADCVIVKGHSRSTLCDLTRREYHLIPNDLNEFINRIGNDTLESVYNTYDKKYHEILDDFFSFLTEKEFIYSIDDNQSNSFPPIDLTFDYPSHVSNFVLEVSEFNITYLDSIVFQIQKLGCFDMQLKTDSTFTESYINILNKAIQKSAINSIELIIKYKDEENTVNILNFINLQIRVTSVVFHSAPIDRIFDEENIRDNVSVLFTSSKYEGVISCGQISHLYFNTNIQLFSESNNHNTCLNRKLSIDQMGNIKNCPSMTESFGNIRDTTLAKVLNKQSFKKYWDIKKDDIAVCKDCEFRHICTDCRVFIEEPQDIYSKPLKCGYNPYTNEWQDWSTNPLKKLTFEYYKNQMKDDKT